MTTRKRSQTVTVPTPPVGKARARTVQPSDEERALGKKAHSYTPQGTRDAEETIRLYWTASNGPRPVLDVSAGLVMIVDAYFPRPKTTRRERPTVRPDLDNIWKLCADSLNGVAYVDDSCITTALCRKRYVTDGDAGPRLEITLTEVEGTSPPPTRYFTLGVR